MAEELYALAPGDFIATRDEWIRFARESGDRKLATQLSALRKPTQAAWVVNTLWRTHRDTVEQLLDLAEPLRDAQEQLAGEQLRQLSNTRRRLVSVLLDDARKQAAQAGARVSADTLRDAGDTLEAGLADPKIAEQIRTGRMTQAASYAGFGPIAAEAVTERTGGAEPSADSSDAESGSDDSGSTRAKTDADRAAARKQAAARVAEAKATRTYARRELAEYEKHLKKTKAERDRLHDEVEQLRRRLATFEEQLANAEEAVQATNEARDQAEAEHADAEQALAAAQDALHELDNPRS